MTELFTKAEFEAALPVVAGQTLWSPLGLVNGEYCYIIPVRPGVVLYVRSSVGPNGVAAGSSEDSIRVWIASGPEGKGLGSKDQRWITRVRGWEKRLTETLRKLWRIAHQLKQCEVCDTPMIAIKSGSVNNPGRFFMKCPTCDTFVKWLTPPVGPNAKANN